MKIHLLVIAFSCLITGCHNNDDYERMQGKWKLSEMSGAFAFDLPPYEKNDVGILSFEENKFIYMNNKNSTRRIIGTYVCDESKNPKQITFTYEEHKITAIYSLSRRRLVICVGQNDDTPPITFAGGPESRPALITYLRE